MSSGWRKPEQGRRTTPVYDLETGNDPASLTDRFAKQGDRIVSDKVQGMARDMAGRAQQAFGGAVGDAKTQAEGVYNQASGQAQEQAARLAEIIRDQPLTAAVIALGIGYIVGRLTG
jgi:uncharacterized protein YjbJ (UPF0337 family)